MPQQLVLTLTDIAHGGEACTRLGDRMVFVSHALPGERVRIELVEEKARWARGRLLEVLQPSPARVEPPCPHFGPNRCEGCQWQHIDRRSQLDFKRRIVRDQLQRLGHLDDPLVRPTLAAEPAWAYRTQALFYPAEEGLGLRRAVGDDIYPLPDCPVLHPALAELYRDFNVAWEGLRSVDFAANPDGDQRLVVLRTDHDEAPEIEVDVPVAIALLRQDGSAEALIGEPWYSARIGAQVYRFSAGARRPSHFHAQTLLVETVTGYLAPRSDQTLLDIYCGSGLFTLALAQRLAAVIGVEEDPISMEDCAFNCRELEQVTLHEGPPAEVLASEDAEAELAVVAPPSTGLEPGLALSLARLGVEKLVYVAYNPATLARDLSGLRQAGYHLREATPIDVAPQTFYVTTVALLTR